MYEIFKVTCDKAFNGSCPLKKLFQIKNSKIIASKHVKTTKKQKLLRLC